MKIEELEAEKIYRETRDTFTNCIKRATVISQNAGGRYTEDKKIFWASVIFTKLVVIVHSISRLAPRTSPVPDKRPHWDYSSVASITRNFIECYFLFFYLCIDKTSNEDEWLTRFNLIQLRDNTSRKQIFSQWDSNDPQLVGFDDHHNALVKELQSRSFFCSLPEKRQVALLKGNDDAMLLTRDEILDRMGKDKTHFRGMWRYLCAHTHSAPIAFYRMAEDGRGCGIKENQVDKRLTSALLMEVTDFLNLAISDMLLLFPDVEQNPIVTVRSGNKKARRRG
ncbi:MAG: DUF5677 domain-containing protein [Methylococcales bacterium]|nr:DUF5677 domain-containing protein [Methylococcales bacterium]